jgi:hypothetical protein
MKCSPADFWKYQQAVYAEILDELEVHFSRINAPYMPIKGAYLLRSNLAGKMGYRRMNDIDILVQEKDFEKVCDYFGSLSNVKFLKHKWYFEKEFDYAFGSFHCHLEIHHLLNYPARFDLPTHALFDRSQQTCGKCVLPSHEDALLILLCHALVHIAYEFRETLEEEITLLSGREGFSWERFWEYADATGVKGFVTLVLCWYARESGKSFPLPPVPFFVRLMLPMLSRRRYLRTPLLLRKIFLEIPYLRRPLWLFVNKVRQSIL